jgi:hypothetical protein
MFVEYRRGSRAALLNFTIGRRFAVPATPALVGFGSTWRWAQELALLLDGPSGAPGVDLVRSGAADDG